MSNDNTFDPEGMRKAAEQATTLRSELGEIKSVSEAIASIEGDVADSMRERYKVLVQVKNGGREYVDSLNQAVKANEDNLKKMISQHGIQSEQYKTAVDALKISQDSFGLAQEKLGISDQELANERELLGIQEQKAGHAGEAADASARLGGSVKNILTATTGINDSWKGTALGQFFMTAKAEGFGAALKKVGGAIKETFTVANVLGSLMIGMTLATIKMAFALDNAQAELAKTTGAGREYDDVLMDSYESTREFGVQAQEAAESFKALHHEFAGFRKMNNTAKAEMTATTALLGQLGVSGADAAGSFEHFRTVMGGGVDVGAHQQFAADMHGLAQELQMSTGQVFAELNANMKNLAHYGPDAQTEFKKLLGIAAETGASIDELTSAVERFDTVAGSVEGAAKFNATLGGAFLDANQMMNSSLSERLILMKRAFDASGRDWQSMNRAERQMIANNAGIEDMTVATKLFGATSATEMQKAADAAAGVTGSMSDLEDAAGKSMSATEKFGVILNSLAVIVGPIITGLHWIADKLIWVDNWLREVSDGWLSLGGVLLFVFGIVKLWGWVNGIMTTFFGTMGAGLTNTAATAAPAGTSMATAITTVGAAAQGAAVPLMKLGVAILLVSLGIGIIVASIALLAYVMAPMGFHMLTFAAALFIVGYGLFLLIPALLAAGSAGYAAAIPLLLVGVALALMGAAVWMAGLGFVKFAEAFMLIVGQLGAFAIFVGLVAVLAIGTLALGIAGFLAMGGLIAMSIGFMALAFALMWISTDDLTALGNMMQGLGKVAEFAGAGMGEAVPKVEDLMDTLLGFTSWFSGSDIEEGLHSLGWAFYDMGVGAERASSYLPLLVSPLSQIAIAATILAAALTEAVSVLPLFVMYMGTLAATMATMGAAMSWSLWTTALGIYDIADALDDIPADKATTFASTLETVADTVPMLQQITPPVVDNVTQLVELAHQYAGATRTMGGLFGGGGDEFVKMLQAATGAGGGSAASSAAGGTGAQVVVLELDGHELGRTVETVLNRRQETKLREK